MNTTLQTTNKQFFYLKLGKGNVLIEPLLTGKLLGYPAVAIFFLDCTIEGFRDGKAISQAGNFYFSGLAENREKTIMVVVDDGCVWFLKPAGNVGLHHPASDSPYIAYNERKPWKVMPVEIIQKQRLRKVPSILAGINANTYLQMGTYRKISHLGNLKAIYFALNELLPHEHLKEENCQPINLFECLSSVELETLVAKLFEDAGCFVPAYRGGYIKDVDLSVHNDQQNPVQLGELMIPAGESKSIQIKGRTNLKETPTSADILIAFGLPNSPNCYNEHWLLAQVRAHPCVLAWFKRSLNWLPNEFISKYDLTEIV
jgi:hypothetical protein